MAIQSLEIAFYNGRTKNTGYTYAGRGESSYNKDAVWSFVAPANRLKKLTVPFTWDNSAAGTGFPDDTDMYFSVTANGETNASDSEKPRLAANDDPDRVHKEPVIVPMSGSSGSVTVEFTDLHLEAGTTYYIRVNAADNDTRSIKGFPKTIEGVTYEKQAGAYIDVNGAKKEASSYVNINGIWRETEPLLNVNGSWTETA